MRILTIILLFVLAGCNGSTPPKLPPTNPGTSYQVTVVVTDGKVNVGGAAVQFGSSDRMGVTNNAGFVEFKVPKGMYRLEVTAVDYLPFSTMVTIDNAAVHQDVKLVRR